MTVATGTRVNLRRARLEDRERVWRWLSEVALRVPAAAGFAHRLPVTREAFSGRFPLGVFDGTTPFDGRGFMLSAGGADVGFIAHGPVNLLADVVALDLWLASPALQGRGYGSEALALLCEWLQRTYGINRFLLRPSRRDVHALRAMRRAGFRETDLESASVLRRLSLPAGAFGDEVLLFRILSMPAPVLQREPGRRYLFIDSEFTHLEDPRLISFAAVGDDGAAYYSEVQGWSAAGCSPFVQQEVLPKLERVGVPRAQAADAFLDWCRARAGADTLTLVSDSGFDRWAVHALLGGEDLPNGLDWQRVPVAYEELDEACRRLSLRRHHALDDARALAVLLAPGARR